MRHGILNRSERIILERITEAAQRALPCPTNGELAGAIGSASTTSASNIIRKLEQRRYIEVERFTNGRVVRIVATGKRTKAPAHRIPHRPRGTGTAIKKSHLPRSTRAEVCERQTSIHPRIELQPGRYVLDADGRLHPFKHKAFVGAVVAVTVRAKAAPEPEVEAPAPAAPVEPSAPPRQPARPRINRVLREEAAPPPPPVNHGGVVVIEPDREIDWSRSAAAHRAIASPTAVPQARPANTCALCSEPHETVRRVGGICTYCRAVEKAL